MAEYIERMSAIATACKGCNKQFSNEPCEPSECYIQQGLFNVTAVDVVEVVRCEKCRFCKEHPTSDKVKICTNEQWNTEYHPFVHDNDFCSYGERREGE